MMIADDTFEVSDGAPQPFFHEPQGRARRSARADSPLRLRRTQGVMRPTLMFMGNWTTCEQVWFSSAADLRIAIALSRVVQCVNGKAAATIRRSGLAPIKVCAYLAKSAGTSTVKFAVAPVGPTVIS